jgi:hypothetical protein
MCNMHDEITSIFDYTLQDGNSNVNGVRANLNGYSNSIGPGRISS